MDMLKKIIIYENFYATNWEIGIDFFYFLFVTSKKKDLKKKKKNNEIWEWK